MSSIVDNLDLVEDEPVILPLLSINTTTYLSPDTELMYLYEKNVWPENEAEIMLEMIILTLTSFNLAEMILLTLMPF